MDQVWVELKHWLVGLAPSAVQPWLAALISVAAIIGVFAGLFALTTLLERKGLGRMQNRYGPNRVGPFGLLQPIADGIKSLTKEDIVPRSADAVVHFLAPLVLVVPVFLVLAVLPSAAARFICSTEMTPSGTIYDVSTFPRAPSFGTLPTMLRVSLIIQARAALRQWMVTMFTPADHSGTCIASTQAHTNPSGIKISGRISAALSCRCGQ